MNLKLRGSDGESFDLGMKKLNNERATVYLIKLIPTNLKYEKKSLVIPMTLPGTSGGSRVTAPDRALATC